MHFCRASRILGRLLLFVAACLCGWRATPALGTTPKPTPQSTASTTVVTLPTAEQIQAELTGLADKTDMPEETRTALGEALKRLHESLTKLGETKTRKKKLEEQIAAIPQELATAKLDLEAPPLAPPQISSHTELERLRSLKSERDAELAAAKSLLADLLAKSENRKTRRVQATEMIASLRMELQKGESEPPPTDPESKTDAHLLDIQRQERDARLELLRQRLALQQSEQRAIEAEEELVPLQINVAQRRVSTLEKEIALLTQAVSNKRESKVESALKNHRDALLAANKSTEDSVIMNLSEKWTSIVRKHGETERAKVEAATREEKLRKELSETQTAIDNDLQNNGSLRSGLGMKLLRQRDQLPDNGELASEIHSVDVRIEEMGAFQAQLEVLADGLDGAVPGSRFAVSSTSSIAQQELVLLGEIDRDVDSYTTELIELKNHLENTRKQTDIFRGLIDKNVLWIRNMRPYGGADLELAWQSFQGIVTPTNLTALYRATLDEMWARPDLVLLWLFICGGLFGFGTKLRRSIRELGEKAAKRNQTALRPTLRVMWMTGLLSLPLFFVFGIPGWRLSEFAGESNYVRAVGNALLLMAMAILPVEMTRQLVRPYGLAILHFNLKESQALVVRNTLRTMIDFGLPLLFVWGVAYYSGVTSINSSLARPLFLTGMLLVAYGMWRIMHPETGVMATFVEKSAGGWVDRLRYVWHWGATAVPVVLGMISLAGYNYSANQLAEQLYWTLWLVLALTIVGGGLRRWVLINRRRLLLAQARQRASEAERREGVPIDLAVETSTLDLSEINAQTLRLINTLMTVLSVVGIYYMWASVLPAIQFLDSFELWKNGLGEDGTVEYVTLGGLLKSLPVILLTFVSVRNVPGLLENVLLQKLPLENAARYAITTLSSYVMLMVGIGYSAKALGLDWESIQWLVAALGVGLGFGLQEIFANFISGIILLFEQPIRVGDVVTIDGTTGAVSKIRMRATTVVNWDRQELIIPNRDLITGRVVNWTLSDSTNRVVINVGVAYGSDTRRACGMLEEICDQHANVAEDPPPVVSFEGFGDSTLNLVIRCYLKTLDVRLKTIHELHTEINERFNRAGIEIAFPQRDLHIRSFPEGFTALTRDSHESRAA